MKKRRAERGETRKKLIDLVWDLERMSETRVVRGNSVEYVRR